MDSGIPIFFCKIGNVTSPGYNLHQQNLPNHQQQVFGELACPTALVRRVAG